ncbi:sodium:solute symporter family protein [Bacillus sp. PK3_68]|uniref:sodium:solute symporter family protein n=1 Tax=Bacillus sp. PK3_68 TaxID=2027408 RepID=UPI000E75ADB8|nr:sodium:solute symporter family protein [Bacillus sp. PK3_68]RJS59355.1 hypothetical protein CJ483_04110 [Bacillus sp. PK3_68]
MNTLISVLVITIFLIANGLIIKKFHKKQDSFEEYAVGGRSFPWILSLFGFLGAFYVGSLYTGSIGYSSSFGVYAQFSAVYAVGTTLTMYIMARPVWKWGKEYNLETNADYAELRYDSKPFGLFIGITTFLFWVPWLIIEMQTLGYLVSAATYGAVPFNLGLFIISAFVLIYSFLGGMRAGTIGDLFQGIFFTFVGSATVIYLLYKVYGGVTPMFEMMAEQLPDHLIINEKFGLWAWSSAIITGTFGGMMNPGIFNRLYMSDSVKSAKKAALVVPIIGSIFVILVMWLALGGSLLDGYPKDPQEGGFWIAKTYGGPVVLGLMGIFALSASMSTISAMSTTSSIIIGKHFTSQKLSRDQKLKYSKLFTLAIGLLCMAIATMDLPMVTTITLYVYECLVQVAPALLLGMYWKRANKYGAAVGTITGMVIVLLKEPFPWLITWANGVSAGLLGLAVNLILFVTISLVTPKPSHVNELFNVLDTRATIRNGKKTASVS